MVSDLASQLAAISANNTTVIDRKKRKKLHSTSLIFEANEAAGQDYETIFSIAIEGLIDLEQLDPKFAAFRNNIFSESSISVDRLVQVSGRARTLFWVVSANHHSSRLLNRTNFSTMQSSRFSSWLLRDST